VDELAPTQGTDPDCDVARRTLRLVLEYDGRDFEGWQVQAGARPARTVQGVLEQAFASIGCPASRIQAAGRTDTGVHAEAQIVGVELERALSGPALVRALNARLPPDVAVRSASEVAPGWNATDAARAKLYRYRIWNGGVRSPLRAGRFAWIPERLVLDRMRSAAKAFVGTHDFSALRAAGSSAKTSVRTIRAIELEGETGDEITLDVLGEGFLRHMVRNLAGTLIEIGRGRFEVADAGRILASLDRSQAGPTAPAHGLTLVRVWETPSLGPGEGRDPVGPGAAEPKTRSRVRTEPERDLEDDLAHD
jgi:tRNA pseudouridine38-40 synthase